jgi:hypothetical protein
MNACRILLPAALLVLPGCSATPQINLLGSFFPAWMLCVGVGVVGTLLLRQVFVRAQLEPHLGVLPVVYFSLWLLLTLACWLLFFRS